MTSRIALALGAVSLTAAALSGVPLTVAQAAPTLGASAAAGGPSQARVTNGCLTSVPDPGTTAPVKICYSIFKPAGASQKHQLPMIIHSHGWGSSRTTDPAVFKPFTDAGYGVLSFDQRGFGESGGQAYVENPTVEGHDVRKLVSLVAHRGWVAKDRPGDPRLGAIGGSYGGGDQFLAAFEELRLKGRPVFDALAPEITWHDLSESLAPSGVVRTEWASALTAAAQPSQALPTKVEKALVEGAATGTYPDGSIPGTENLVTFFRKNGPTWHTDHGRKLDIPVLFGQGTTDSLFPLEQGLQNWHSAITSHARKNSIFVGYNGGHVLPALFPKGVSVTSDPCSKRLAGGSFQRLSIRFFNEQLKHRDTGLQGYGKLHIATPTSTCTTVRSVAATKSYDVGTVAIPTTAGAPINYKIADGPLKVAGTPYLTGQLTALGVTNRAFYGLAMGTSPADAQLVQDNVLPINEGLVTGEARRIALPSVAVNVPAGQSLFLLATPISDSFGGMSSRTPGAITLDDSVVHLPVVAR